MAHLKEDIPWDLSHPETTLEIIPGTEVYDCDNFYSTVGKIIRVLRLINPNLIDKVKFRHFPDESSTLGPSQGIDNPRSVVSYLGQIVCHPVKIFTEKFKPGGGPCRPNLRMSQGKSSL